MSSVALDAPETARPCLPEAEAFDRGDVPRNGPPRHAQRAAVHPHAARPVPQVHQPSSRAARRANNAEAAARHAQQRDGVLDGAVHGGNTREEGGADKLREGQGGKRPDFSQDAKGFAAQPARMHPGKHVVKQDLQAGG